MEDTKRSLSPKTRLYNELHDFVSLDQRGRLISLINSAVATPDTISDEEIARQQQGCLYDDSVMEIDEPVLTNTSTLDADAAYALQLQEQEYNRDSIIPSRTYKRRGSNNRSNSYNDERLANDAAIAAQLQAEEDQRRSRNPLSRPMRLQRPTPNPIANHTIEPDEPEIIPIPPFAASRSNHRASRGNNQRNNRQFQNLFQILSSHGHRNPNIQNIDQDFGPDDYENLLQLDNGLGKTPLTRNQINILPTENYHRLPNKTDDENQCSVCMDQLEENQIIRRLPCLHIYHKQCIDNWLKDNNLCPICRMPPIK